MARFRTPDDVGLFYQESGSGTPIVFVHEFGGDYRSWDDQVDALSDRFRCITFSARGFNPSDIPGDVAHYGQSFSTADVLALFDHLGLDQAHIVGTSMGSFTSLDFALNHADRAASVTLIGNSSGPRDENERDSYRANWIGSEMRLRKVTGGAGAVAVLEADPAYQSFQKNDPARWEIYAENLRGQSAQGAINVLSTVHWNRVSLFDDIDRLHAFSKPVMLVTGDEDYYLVGETNAFLNDVLKDVRWHRFSSTGHLVNIERAKEFNRLLADFAFELA